MRSRYYNNLHFTDKETEAKKVKLLAKVIQIVRGRQDFDPNNLVLGTMLLTGMKYCNNLE